MTTDMQETLGAPIREELWTAVKQETFDKPPGKNGIFHEFCAAQTAHITYWGCII
jgi:hypothetical protein